MKTYTIENESNNITVHVTAEAADGVANAERFRNEAGLAKLAAEWPVSRLVEIWNSLPGATPVKRFKDRATAVSRIWKALQSPGDAVPVHPVIEFQPATTAPAAQTIPSPESVPATPVAPQRPNVATGKVPTKNNATRAAKARKAATNAGVPREGSKTSQVITMLKREGGTTLEEIMTRMGWQKHTARAMLSAGGSLTKNHGLVIISEKVGNKRSYSIKA